MTCMNQFGNLKTGGLIGIGLSKSIIYEDQSCLKL